MKPNKSVAVMLLALASTVSMQGAVSLVSISSIKASGYAGSGNGNSSMLSEFTGGTVGTVSGTSVVGLTKVDPNDVSTWTHGSNWQEGWQAGKVGGTNIGWVVLDFGSSQADLGTMYLWNVTEGNPAQYRGTKTFNIWYTDSPTTTVPGSGSYNFSTSGWTQLGGTNDLAIGGSTGVPLTGSFDISGIDSARYVAIEILTNYGSSTPAMGETPAIDGTTNRVGLAEIVITQVPEPSGALLLGSSCLALLFRRRVA